MAIKERERKEIEAKPIEIGKPIPKLDIPTLKKSKIKKLSPIKKF